MDLKEIIKERREYLGITQQDLAEMSQIGLATIKNIERGKGNPSLNIINSILDILGLEAEYKVRRTV